MNDEAAYRSCYIIGHVLLICCRIGLTCQSPGSATSFARELRRWCSAVCGPTDDDEKKLQKEITKRLHKLRLVYTGRLIGAASWIVACSSIGFGVHVAVGGDIGKVTSNLFLYATAMGCMLLAWDMVALTSFRIDLICALIVVWVFLRPSLGYESVYRYLMASGFVFCTCFACSVVQIEFKKPFLFHAVIYGARLANIPKYFLHQEQPDVLESLKGVLPVFVLLEVLQCFFSLALVFIGQRLCREVTRESILRRATQVELRSAVALVSRLCDSIVRLDENGRILGKASRFADLLMKGTQSSCQSLTWEQFEHYVLAEDRHRFREFLRQSGDPAEEAASQSSQDDYDCYDPAEAFHIRLRDSMGLSFHVELYHVTVCDISGQHCHLLGLRDVSNLPVVWNERSSKQSHDSDQHHIAVDNSASNPVLDLTIQRQVKIDNISLSLHAQAGPTMWLAGYTVNFKSAIQVWSAASPPDTVFSRSAWEDFFVWLDAQRKKQQHDPEWTSLPAGALSFKLPYLGQATSATVKASVQTRMPGEDVERLVVSMKTPSICRVVMARHGKRLKIPVPRVASEELTTLYGRREQQLDREDFLQVSAHQTEQSKGENGGAHNEQEVWQEGLEEGHSTPSPVIWEM
eukprot:TRINITY_DN17011_c0_g1_i1.p1 TRINITY_DN17011_c0_g1~~TRINITY_DN17011_c0_g1_i1.p1  ORF type:complete len:632 (+),score=62.53 TRINITY_DN17011_c0_g1_i1:191-2086(+)